MILQEVTMDEMIIIYFIFREGNHIWQKSWMLSV